jgi:hypothetical protein
MPSDDIITSFNQFDLIVELTLGHTIIRYVRKMIAPGPHLQSVSHTAEPELRPYRPIAYDPPQARHAKNKSMWEIAGWHLDLAFKFRCLIWILEEEVPTILARQPSQIALRWHNPSHQSIQAVIADDR